MTARSSVFGVTEDRSTSSMYPAGASRHRQMGVGGDDSWGAQTHDQYKLFADRDYQYTYRLRPITRRDDAMSLSRRPTATT